MRLPIRRAAHQARDTGVDVHHRAAREVERALLEQEAGVDVAAAPASAACRHPDPPRPDHVRDREVGEGEPEDHEQQHRGELHAFGEGADDQAGRDGGERQLEAEVDKLGDVHALAEGAGQRVAASFPS